ncbi:MAG: protein kinase, partial [Candidatus Saccharimonas sp.]|nr:protein kinase [Planctomycetaceae bacterium]
MSDSFAGLESHSRTVKGAKAGANSLSGSDAPRMIEADNQGGSWWDAADVESNSPPLGEIERRVAGGEGDSATVGKTRDGQSPERQTGDATAIDADEIDTDESVAWPPYVGDPFSGKGSSSSQGLSARKSPVGELIMGDYTLIREIGRGGMGVVYEAVDRKLHRRAAVKVLTLNASNDPRLAARFHHEARIVARLNHPNIVTVYGSGEHEGTHYIAFQLVEGRSLDLFLANPHLIDEAAAANSGRVARDRMKGDRSHAAEHPADRTSPGSSTLRWRWIADVGRQAAAALQHAHETVVIHRDVKPSNLIVEEGGQLWVTDFGLAHVSDMSHLTAAGDLLGTLRYMSPEQATGQRGVLDRRTDIYSLGITLYELAAGRAAFATEDRAALLKIILFESPKPIQRVVPGIPRDLATIIGKAIAKLPSERYSTSKAMENDLRRFLNGIPIEARPPTWIDWGRYYATRHKLPLTVALVLMFLFLTTWSFVSQRHSKALGDQVDLLTDARRQAIKRERQTLMLLAQRGRATTVPGRRQESLAALERAVTLGRDVPLDDDERRQLRDEWIAALAIPIDLVPRSVKEFENPIWVSVIDPDFSRVVRGRHDAPTLEVFPLDASATPAEPARVIPVETAPFNYVMSPGGKIVTAIKSDPYGATLRLENWDIDTGKRLSMITSPGFRAVSWNDDGRRIAALAGAGEMSIVEAVTGSTSAKWQAPAGSFDLSWRKGVDELLVSAPGKLHRCEPGTGNVLETQSPPFDVRKSEPHPNGQLLYGVDVSSRLRSWNIALKSEQLISTEPLIRYVVSADGRVVATESQTGASTLWDAMSGERLLTLMGRPVAFDRTGSRFASCNSRSLATWDVIHSDVFRSIPLRVPVAGEVYDASFTGDSRWMALASDAGICLFELATGREVSIVEPGTRSVQFVAEGGKVSLVSTVAGVRVHERKVDPELGVCGPPREVCVLDGGTGPGSGFAIFASGGRWIGVVDGLSRPTVIDRTTGAVRQATPQINAYSSSVSPDGRWCVSGTFHGRTIRLWDLSGTGEPSPERELWDAQPHSRPAFSPDGAWLVVAATNETRVWDTRTWQVVYRQQRLD